MKVLFIYNGSENKGIEILSSVLKSNGHTTSLLFDSAVFSGQAFFDFKWLGKFFSMDKKIINRAIGMKPDLICFSTFTGNYLWSLKIAEGIKKELEVPIVFGGIHATAVPEIVLKNDFLDYVVVGEGEQAIVELLEHISSKRSNKNLGIKNLGYKYDGQITINPLRPYLRDLDSLPMPDVDMFYNKVPLMSEIYRIMTTRGCPYACTFCSNSLIHKLYFSEKNHIRRRSVSNVIQELKLAKSKYHSTSIIFSDEVFTLSADWLKEFIPLYKAEIGLKFGCLAHPSTVTREIVDLLKEGGCWSISMGIQSGSERIRRDVFHRYYTNEKVKEVCSMIKQAGIQIHTDFILGSPTESEEDIIESFRLIEAIRPDKLLTFFLTYYPQTEIVNCAINENIITPEDYEDIKRGYIGYTHSFGSLDKNRAKMYSSYELLFQSRVLIRDDTLFLLFSKICPYLPFKKVMVKGITFLISLRNGNVRYFYYLKYIFTKKNVP